MGAVLDRNVAIRTAYVIGRLPKEATPWEKPGNKRPVVGCGCRCNKRNCPKAGAGRFLTERGFVTLSFSLYVIGCGSSCYQYCHQDRREGSTRSTAMMIQRKAENIDVIPLLHTLTARFSFSNNFFPSVSALLHGSPSLADCGCRLFLALYNETNPPLFSHSSASSIPNKFYLLFSLCLFLQQRKVILLI